jgi:hypothetical protein
MRPKPQRLTIASLCAAERADLEVSGYCFQETVEAAESRASTD